MLIACIAKDTVIAGGKILALLEVLLLLLLLIVDAFDGLCCILVNSSVACIGAPNDINAILFSQPRVRLATPIATKLATTDCAAGLVGPLIPTFVFTHGLLCLAGINLGGECWTGTNSLTSNCPGVGVLCLGMNGGLDYFLKNLVLVSGRLHLQLAVVGKVCTKAGMEARIKAIHKGLTKTGGKLLLVDGRTRGSKDLSTIV